MQQIQRGMHALGMRWSCRLLDSRHFLVPQSHMRVGGLAARGDEEVAVHGNAAGRAKPGSVYEWTSCEKRRAAPVQAACPTPKSWTGCCKQTYNVPVRLDRADVFMDLNTSSGCEAERFRLQQPTEKCVHGS